MPITPPLFVTFCHLAGCSRLASRLLVPALSIAFDCFQPVLMKWGAVAVAFSGRSLTSRISKSLTDEIETSVPDPNQPELLWVFSVFADINRLFPTNRTQPGRPSVQAGQSFIPAQMHWPINNVASQHISHKFYIQVEDVSRLGMLGTVRLKLM